MGSRKREWKESMQDISREILIKASEGDLGSFEIIYKATADFVYNVAYRIVSNRHDAEEIAQEVFLSVYHKLKDFRFQSSLKTWIYRITVNCAINYSKKMSREKEKRKVYDEDPNTAKVFDAPAVRDSDKTREEIIGSLLANLNPDQKACIVLRSIEGLSYEEIADTLKIGINTVRSRLKRAREKLLSLKKEVIKNEM
jgi:RNA polymerase sigma-70 factor (ECF subfamily)